MVAQTRSPEISGDLLVLPRNCWYLAGPPNQVAAMHGTPWTNDAHVPLIFLGPRWIRPGKDA